MAVGNKMREELEGVLKANLHLLISTEMKVRQFKLSIS